MPTTVRGTAGADRLIGLAGEDILFGLGGADELIGDLLGAVSGAFGDDTLFGGAGRDRLDGVIGDDRLFGGSGGDTLSGGDGRDALFGGRGADRVVVNWGRVDGAAGWDTRADTAAGGGGRDTLVVSGFNEGRPLDMSGDLKTGFVVGSAGEDLIRGRGFESLEYQSFEMADVILIGGNGDDLIEMAGGQHRIDTGSGRDRVSISLDDTRDVIDLGPGIDTVAFRWSGFENVVFRLDRTKVLVAEATAAVFRNAEVADVTSGGGDDLLIGGARGDTLASGDGADVLRGRGGNDTLQTGLLGGRSIVDGGPGTDHLTVVSSFSPAFDMSGTSGSTARITQISTETELVFARRVETLEVFGSRESDTIIGLNGNDTLLTGRGGDDLVIGRSGDDRIVVQSADGDAVLTGGSGADRFEFWSQSGTSVATVTDFGAQDAILVVPVGQIGAVAPVFVQGSAPSAATNGPTILHDTDTGLLSYDADGAGANAPDALAVLLARGSVADLSIDQFL